MILLKNPKWIIANWSSEHQWVAASKSFSESKRLSIIGYNKPTSTDTVSLEVWRKVVC